MSQDQVRKPRASLGSSEGEDIFGTFDAGVAKRFLGMMVPYRRAFLTAVVAVLVSAASVVAIPALIGRAVNAAVAGDGALLDQTLIAFAGLVAVLLAVFEILLSVRWLHRLDRRPQALGPAAPRRDRRWWLFLAVTAALPAVTFFPLMKLGMLFLPMPLYPQWITNQLLVWALGGAALTLVIGLATKAPRPEVGADWPRSAAIALLTVGVNFVVDWMLWRSSGLKE